MARPMSPTTSWMRGLDLPSKLFELGSDDYELFEEDDEFVLRVELPGFERDEIDISWQEDRLNIAAEHEDDVRGRTKTYHRSFRFPKEVDEDAITAAYENGILEVTLPVVAGTTDQGKTIEIEG